MGKSFSRHGRSSYSRVPSENRSQTTGSSHVNETIRVNVGVVDKNILRCRIVIDGESVVQLIRTRDENSRSSLVFDIPIKVFRSSPSSEICDRVKSAPPGWLEQQVGDVSADGQLPPPYPLGSKVDQDNATTNTADLSVALHDNNQKIFGHDQLQHLLHQLSASPVEIGRRTVHLRRSGCSATSQHVVDQAIRVVTTTTSNDAGVLVKSTKEVCTPENLASRVRRADDDDDGPPRRRDLAGADVEGDNSPWERLLLPDVTVVVPVESSPTVERRVVSTCTAAPCCLARVRQCEESASKTGVDNEQDDRGPAVDFDKRQLAELLRQNLDLNVQLSRQRTRKRRTNTSPPLTTRRSADNDRFACQHSTGQSPANQTHRLSSAVPLPNTTELPNRTSPPLSPPVNRVTSFCSTVMPSDRKPEDFIVDRTSSADDVLVLKRDWLNFCADEDVEKPAATSSPKLFHQRRSSAGCRPPRRVVIGGQPDDNEDASPRRRGTCGTRRPPEQQPETVSASHYYRRHRHRARNQTRAMLQVAEWIEKAEPTTRNGSESDDCDGRRRDKSAKKKAGKVCRHEHYHYHYHYGVETAPLGLVCSNLT